MALAAKKRALVHAWCSQVRQAGVIAVAEAFGGTKLIRPDDPRAGLTPCPACGASTRHTKRHDKRGAVGLTRDGMGWRCFQCDAGGDAVALAAWLAGDRGRVNRRLAETCRRIGLLTQSRRDEPNAMRPCAPTSPCYPPTDELAPLLRQLEPVDLTPEPDIRNWLMRRRIDPNRVANLSTVGALPKNAMLPQWATFGSRPWTHTGHRLIVSLFDADGALCSLHARRVTNDGAGCKSLSPRGYEIRGLVMACPLGRSLLQNCNNASDLASEEHFRRISAHGAHGVGVVICEGVPDWLTQCTSYSDADPDAPAVLGMLSGSWTRAHAARVPDGCVVLVATHNDAAGDKYAEQIRQSFTSRAVTLRRWRPKQVTP